MVQPAMQSRPSDATGDQPSPTPAAMEEPGRGRPSSPGAPQGTPGAPKGSPGPAWPGGPGGSGPKKRKIAWPWLIFALVLVGLVIYAVIPHGQPGQGGAGAAGGRGGRGAGGRGGAAGGGGAPVSVNTAQVVQADVPIYLDALGTVTPTATVTVRPQVSGQITRIAFNEGQMVKKGQFLVEIDPRPAQQALAQAEGVLGRDQANLQNAQVTLKRYQTLLQQDSIARQDVDNQEATVRQLEATIKTDQAAVGQARLNLDYTHITAPVEGRVGLRQVDVGNYVAVGQATTTTGSGATANGLVTITQVAPIDVLFTLPEDNLPQVTARLRAGAELPATAYDRAQSAELAHGKLLTLDNLIDTATGTVKVKARFANTDGALFPNQFVNVKILADTIKGAVTVPSSAVLRGSQGLIVYVVKPDHTVTVRTVMPGQVSGQITEIKSGLMVGETVVTDGTDRLREGSRVILPGECPPAGGGQGGRGGRRGQGGGQGGQGAQKQGGGFFGLGGGNNDQQQGQRQGGGRRGQGGQGGGFGGGGFGCRPGQGGQAAGQAGGAQTGPGAIGRTGGFGRDVANGVTPPSNGATTQNAPAQAGAIASSATQAGAQQGPRQPGGNPEATSGGQGAFGGGQRGLGGGQGGGQGGRGGGMRLFDQLNLSADQKSKIAAIMQEARSKMQGLDDPDARRQALQGANQRAEALLTPAQKTQYEQLRAQQRANFQRNGGGGGGFGGGND